MKDRLKKKISNYLITPIILSAIILVAGSVICLADSRIGLAIMIVAGVLFISEMILFFAAKAGIMPSLVRFALEQGQIQKELLRELAVPYALLDSDGRILWGNDMLVDVLGDGSKRRLKKNIASFFPQITADILDTDEVLNIELEWEDARYQAELKRISVMDIGGESEEEIDNSKRQSMIAMYLFDNTELYNIRKENEEQKLVSGLLYIDNYEEVMENTDESRHSLVEALVDRRISMYLRSFDAIGKKFEKDKYIFIFKHKFLPQLQETKFAILDEVKSINVGNEIPITLSIGIGTETETFMESYEQARVAIGFALARGGDQAAIKIADNISYYGGKSLGTEKTTRVKARVKAQAFKELLENKDKVFIMGHKRPDADAFGASIGVYRTVRALDKEAHIVINDDTQAVAPVLAGFRGNGLYGADMFINSQEAISSINGNTVVVVCDVNRPSMTACEEILSLTKNIVVFDHHRQSNETIRNATLSYIEPYASSASEMVTEMIQYIDDKVKLKPIEADALYSGMVIDTDNFVQKTGVRTFEAAAYLRRNGADVIRVRKMFRSDIISRKELAEGVLNSELYLGFFALSKIVAKDEGTDSPTVIAAKVANDLLDVEGVRASFVITEKDGTSYISGRSVDDVNVQVILEKMGGGGHANIAGAQLAGVSADMAMSQIKELLNNMYSEGDI